MSLQHKYRRWQTLSRLQRSLLMEAVAYLAIARALLLSVPFRWIAAHLRRPLPVCLKDSESDTWLQRQIGHCVAAAAPHVPWKAQCLAQAMAARWMLRRRGYNATLHLGVGRANQGDMLAHAWLEADGVVIVGAGSRELVVPIARLD